jgi:hypothetical protein
MSDRRIDAFFYGLFMDSDILCESNVTRGRTDHSVRPPTASSDQGKQELADGD